MKTIVIKDLSELEQLFLRAVHIMAKERKYEDRWNTHHDTADKEERQKWSEERNSLLDGLTVKGDGRHNLPQELKLETNQKNIQ